MAIVFLFVVYGLGVGLCDAGDTGKTIASFWDELAGAGTVAATGVGAAVSVAARSGDVPRNQTW